MAWTSATVVPATNDNVYGWLPPGWLAWYPASRVAVGSCYPFSVFWLGVLAALARSFAGFHADEDKYLAGNQACAVLVAGKDGTVAGTPRCAEVDREAQKGFKKPERGRELDGKKLAVSVEDGKIKLIWLDGGRERLLARWSPGTAYVTSVSMGMFATRGLVAVEYRAGATADVVAFDVRAPLGGEATAPAPAPAPAPSTEDRTIYQRVLARGGIWEQRQRACDQAGVHLALTKDRKFDIRIETKCQGQKDVTRFQGMWVPEGKDGLVLTFSNDDGPEERVVCRIAACPDAAEDCLSCAADEVTFLLYIVRR
jgi:hypothetical protein